MYLRDSTLDNAGLMDKYYEKQKQNGNLDLSDFDVVLYNNNETI